MAVAVSHNVATVWRSGSMSVTSIQQNYNPYEGDEPLLATAAQRTRTLWKHALFNKEGHVKSKYRICFFLVIVVTLGASLGAAQSKELPKILILATGGTIAGAAATGTQAGYTSGAVTIDAMLSGNMNKVSLRAAPTQRRRASWLSEAAGS
jgi:hypothetical protein